MNKLSDFEYELKKELIAQFPLEKRDNSRMMVIDKKTGEIEHKHFFDFIDYLNKDDVLVLNDTKVVPARLLGQKKTGAKIEIFLIRPLENNCFSAVIKNLKRLKNGDTVEISPELSVLLKQKGEIIKDDIPENIVELIYKGNIENILNKYGSIPLPPYINRSATQKDKETYQTVYAKTAGSAACPTAGLHFTKEILQKIEKKGVKIAYITLNVGLGTFLPVKSEKIENHKMHKEKYIISKKTADIINNKKGALIAAGTTVTRCLEACFQKHNAIIPTEEETDIFIYPPFEFKVTQKLLTNFHLPKSTLLMLVSAFCSKETILNAYKIAVDENYRFFSYGDCTFLK